MSHKKELMNGAALSDVLQAADFHKIADQLSVQAAANDEYVTELEARIAGFDDLDKMLEQEHDMGAPEAALEHDDLEIA